VSLWRVTATERSYTASLANFETNKTKLLQIVLVGQVELGTAIDLYLEQQKHDPR
jgi:type II secretory pathway predicted ATPase ExeA